MVSLIRALALSHAMLPGEAMATVGVKTHDEIRRYLRFLTLGGFVAESGGTVVAQDRLQELWQALRECDRARALSLLREVPAVDCLCRFIAQRMTVSEDDPGMPVPAKARRTYLNLGEGLAGWVRIPGIGIVSTPESPAPAVFDKMAIDAYKHLRDTSGADDVLVGQWLELLAQRYAVHPVVARQCLSDARSQRRLSVQPEGSTPDTRFDSHRLWLLSCAGGEAAFAAVRLYHGDFLIPGTAAVRIRVQELSSAT
jgi:hypothetical protein